MLLILAMLGDKSLKAHTFLFGDFAKIIKICQTINQTKQVLQAVTDDVRFKDLKYLTGITKIVSSFLFP